MKTEEEMTSTNKDGRDTGLAGVAGSPVRLSGLQKVCKIYGRMKCGDAMMAWDYVNDVALPESEFRKDKARWAASERAKYGVFPNKGPSHERSKK